MKPTNITEQKFGKLTALIFDHKKDGQHFWQCKCDCGNTCIVRKQQLTSGQTASCGCIKAQKGKNSLRFNGCGEIPGSYICKKKYDAKNKNIEFSVTAHYIWDLFLTQGRKCALSDIDIRFSNYQGDYDADASLDRIDSSKGYVEGNVQWIHKDINYMKNDFEQNHFIELCKKISNKA